MSFVHLHNHSHYSLLDGAQHIKPMIKKVKELGMPAIALTDHGNMYGAMEFYQTAKDQGVQPIIGMEAYIVGKGSRTERKKGDPDTGLNKTYHLVLLCKNEEGYRNLSKLSSLSFTEGYYYKPRIDKEILRRYSRGLIGLTACLGGEVTNLHLRGHDDLAREAALEYADIFGVDDFYLEVQRHGMEEDTAYQKNVELAKELGLKYVATNDCHYTEKDHWDSHDILICMQGGKSYVDPNRHRYKPQEFYLRSPDEMRQLFQDLPQACDATLEIAEKCQLDLTFGKYKMPNFPIPESEGDIDDNEYLRRKTERGLEWRYGQITDEIRERADHELKIIQEMGFSSYFLITLDFIEAARERNIPVGLGRGSAAGSIVAYATGITGVDPLKYNLLFERFLNPERVSMPDVDIDFCMRRREEVIDYVRQKYGEKNVCQIITYGTLASKNAVKDVARVLDIPFDKANQITKLIPVKGGKPMKVADAFRDIPELVDLVYSDDPIYKDLAKHAEVLEGVAKSTGIHAAGVIIAPDEVSNLAPVAVNSDGIITTQYDMNFAEKIGLLKMDFLGLRTLTVIDDAVRMIQQTDPDSHGDFDIETIPMDDEKTYRLYGKGNTVGVFQFESKGMQEYLRKLKPNRIEDLIAMNALYRPGPMQFIDDFIDRKYGRKEIEYLHPMLEPILKETYGIIVYQEQVMKIVSDLGGFSLGEADLVRRAMGKKKLDIMEAYKVKFIDQAKSLHGIDEAVSGEIYELIVKFASYGFNKSHSAAYSILSYQTAYLKAHFPAAFMASIMSSEITSPDRIMIYMDECKQLGLKVIPPDVNISFPDFSAPDAETVAFGMHAIKNVGRSAINSIVEAREERGTPFQTLFELVESADSRLVNKKALESLIQAGALDSLRGTRSQKFASLDIATEFAAKVHSNKQDENQFNLFGDATETVRITYPSLIDVPDWPSAEMLTREKELLGFYVSGHPLEPYKQLLEMHCTVQSDQLDMPKEDVQGRLGGMITNVRPHLTKKGDKMAFVKAENFHYAFEAVIFPKTFAQYSELLQEANMVMFSGRISYTDKKDIKILPDDIFNLSDAETMLISEVELNLGVDQLETDQIRHLNQFLSQEFGDIPVYFNLSGSLMESPIRFLSRKFRINSKPETIQRLRELVPPDSCICK